MGVKIKICGITNLKDALFSIEAGCDALGFVFYRKSPRYITPQKAREIIKNLPKDILKVGVFVNEKEKEVKRIARGAQLKVLQFHGNESYKFCQRFKDYKIIKAFRIKDKLDIKDIQRYQTFAYLFDTFLNSKPGGTGRKFNWKLLRHLKIKKPIFLSGGINVKNVLQAIEYVHPDWIDASSSLEKTPGKKDHNLIKLFITLAKSHSHHAA